MCVHAKVFGAKTCAKTCAKTYRLDINHSWINAHLFDANKTLTIMPLQFPIAVLSLSWHIDMTTQEMVLGFCSDRKTQHVVKTHLIGCLREGVAAQL
eukprot:COSAG06_NODE_35834_length_455_cov_0.719101_1_plen_96_part_10